MIIPQSWRGYLEKINREKLVASYFQVDIYINVFRSGLCFWSYSPDYLHLLCYISHSVHVVSWAGTGFLLESNKLRYIVSVLTPVLHSQTDIRFIKPYELILKWGQQDFNTNSKEPGHFLFVTLPVIPKHNIGKATESGINW